MEGKHVADVSLELLTKGRKLATQLGCQLETICAGTDLADVEKQVLPYGVDRVHVFDAPGLFPYTSLPHTSILVNLFKEEKPQICLMGATVIGRDLGPRVSSALTSGLTADCTQLEIGNHEDKKNGITYENLLYQIRPARKTVSPMKTCCIRFVRPSVVTLWLPSSIRNIVRRWLPYVKV